MQLIPATIKHVQQLMCWFPSEQSLSLWSGPDFRYPFNEQTFIEDIKLATIPSFVLVNEQKEMLAFGQFYLRLNRCHLSRLVVNAEQRGKGLADILLSKLIDLGTNTLNTREASLFVLSDNMPAIKAYKKNGFQFFPYPEALPIDHCDYMTKRFDNLK